MFSLSLSLGTQLFGSLLALPLACCERGDAPVGSWTLAMKNTVYLLKGTPQLIKVACALRMKYRKGDKVRLAPFLVGFHPRNRGGLKPSGMRILELLCILIQKGFDAEEADCGGIVVDCQTSMVMVYNTEMCSGDPLLVATIDGKGLSYGSLAHSHLNQVLKNILSGRVTIPEEFREALAPILGHSNTVEFSRLQLHDATMAEYVNQGLLFEVLDSAMESEEPEGVDIIQAAANEKNSAAFVHHEMEALKLLCDYCSAESETATEVLFSTMRDKLGKALPQFAYDPDLVYLFKLVMNTAGEKGQHLKFLCDFLTAFVDPAKRRLRLQAFSVVTELPNAHELPHMMMAILIRSYCAAPRHTFCDSPVLGHWKYMVTKHNYTFVLANRLLQFFFNGLREELQKIEAYPQNRFLGNLYKEVANAFSISVKPGHLEVSKQLKHSLAAIAQSYMTRYGKLTGDTDTKSPEWFSFGEVEAEASSGSGAGPEPKTLKLGATTAECREDGTVVAKEQKTGKVDAMVPDVMDVQAWLNDAELRDIQRTHQMKCTAFHAYLDLARRSPGTPKLLVTTPVIEGEKAAQWKVIAQEDFQEKELILVPFLSSAERLMEKLNMSPDAIVVTVQEESETQCFHVTRHFDTMTDENLHKAHRKHKNMSRSPFWACERSHQAEKFNCELIEVTTTVVSCFQWNSIGNPQWAPMTSNCKVSIPVLVNTAPIKSGDEVVLKAEAPQKQKPKEKRPASTWETQALQLVR